MKKLLMLLLFLAFGIGRSLALSDDSLNYRSFGKVRIYEPKGTSGPPQAIVIFISGDGGWGNKLEAMTRKIAFLGALVVGVDNKTYYRNIKKQQVKCYYPAADFETLSMAIQKKYKTPQYLKPVLVGFSSGATLSYGMVAQAPANTFKGAILLGFCPDIELDKTLCNGTGLTSYVVTPGRVYYLEPTRKLKAPVIVLQGGEDLVCPPPVIEKFMKGLPDGEYVFLPKVGHGFSKIRTWWPQFVQAYEKIEKAPVFGAAPPERRTPLVPFNTGLPLTLVPALAKDLPLIFAISGDGGWTSFDESISRKLAEKGMPVIGLDAQQYFWQRKDPAQTAAIIARTIEHYLAAWNRQNVVLIGYSFGANVIPFIALRFPPELKSRLQSVVCLSPDQTTAFEIRLTDMLELETTETYNVLQAVKSIKPYNPICVFGSQENTGLPKKFANTGAKIVMLPGNHHYNENYDAIADAVLENYGKK
ncbi:AcvB/VirJ family lysyl-phosphatidylglycerol hydrolase [Adhaeribacter soli]|uniref:Virulence factor n=1 Tax=Adhaeribacter soli TaxID=2607655 RepID=A0A5N1IXJ6_9BACT|nr:AcvB/VirJ family lysyl-phosphatidylglycerol hydrolase [Adhaeribacter soli]KAA9332792.1 virulence factor [Adhaeribacter soli]